MSSEIACASPPDQRLNTFADLKATAMTRFWTTDAFTERRAAEGGASGL